MKQNESLTLGSLFDGSGGFPLGGLLAGVTPVWASEIEPFPIRVTTQRFPNMKHYGDISQMDGGKIEPVDIITFGSPCTDMSIAGKRAGLEGHQSSLFYQAIRIIKEMRCATNGQYPRWVCWENVPGSFSSNDGQDFKAVLEAVIGIVEPGCEVPAPAKSKWPHADCYLGDGWSVAYRTLDAQYWGVPQRRRRIYLVGDLTGQCAGRVLFESEGLSGYSAESFRSWQRIARDPSCCSETAGYGLDGYNGTLSEKAATLGVNCGMSTDRNGVVLNDQGGSRMDITHEVTCTLRAESHHPPCVVDEAVPLEHNPVDSRIKVMDTDVSQTLTHRMGTGGNNVPLVLKIRSGCEGGGKGPLIQKGKSATLACSNDQTLFVPQAFSIGANQSKGMLSSNPHSGIYKADSSRTLDANGGNPACSQGGIAVVNGPVFSMTPCSFTQVAEEKVPTLAARDYKDPTFVNQGYSVRRLTPTECARLQGFPDWWCSGLETPDPTQEDIAFWTEVWETHRRIFGRSSKPKSRKQIIKWLQSPHSDSAEYKMWGNGVALPCVFFVLAGIVWSTQNPAQ